MTDVRITDSALRAAAAEGTEVFLQAVTNAVKEAAGDALTAETMQELSAQQVTLWAISILREEVSEGGFVQLIHNGWGPFFFQNPFARAIKDWGLRDLSKMMYAARDLYHEHAEALTHDCTDEEFMALYEQFPDFDPLDDEFVDREDEFVETAARYVDEHLEDFVSIEGKP
ncbi:MAG: DMP19 family protein [Alloprevotella sp.]|nr:DMP19 family protein [Alloprevotella sp.]